MKLIEKSELSQVSLLTILLCFSAFAAGLSAEAILMKWELWPLLPIIACVVISWILHIQQIFSEKHRCLIYAAFVLFAFFSRTSISPFLYSSSNSFFTSCSENLYKVFRSESSGYFFLLK